MLITKNNIQKLGFALLLAIPIFFLYGLHYLNHDTAHLPTGFIQWEHMFYMCSAKEYATGNALFLYEYPILNGFNDGAVFFQPQFLLLGYCWKWLGTDPGTLLMLFGFIFTILTLRVVIEIIALLIPQYRYKNIITLLFCWGGGLLSLSGLFLHFTLFKGSWQNISANIFFLDPGNGGWCLNFGRSLMYPLEAYYHFLFVYCILLLLRKKFISVFFVLLLLILSHPYTSIELLCIILAWITMEVFYFKNKTYNKSQFYIILAAFGIFLIYYTSILGKFETYKQISKLVALDWGYKAWHFVPAYGIVWFLCFLCIKKVALLKAHFSKSTNRLFFWWGIMAFLLSIHGFAVKPVQPIHFTRGYVYSGFFLFCIPALQQIINNKCKAGKIKGWLVSSVFYFIFLFDNITWFSFSAEKPNSVGTYFSVAEKDLINFFKNKNDTAIIIGSEKNYPLAIAIQLYGDNKAWIPHPILTFDIDNKRKAVNDFLEQNKKDEAWINKNIYLYIEKNDNILQSELYLNKAVFENSTFKVYKIN